MPFNGNNARYGASPVELSETRTVQTVVTDEPAFPQGAGGLLPVVSVNSRGVERIDYAFPCPAQEMDDADLEPGSPAQVLANLVESLNAVLDEASEIAEGDYGWIDCPQVEIPAAGYGFTRATKVSVDLDGKPSEPHMRLTLETSEEPGSPYTLTALVEYDAAGRPCHYAISVYEPSGKPDRIGADFRHHLQRFAVTRIEEGGSCIYKVDMSRKKAAVKGEA